MIKSIVIESIVSVSFILSRLYCAVQRYFLAFSSFSSVDFFAVFTRMLNVEGKSIDRDRTDNGFNKGPAIGDSFHRKLT